MEDPDSEEYKAKDRAFYSAMVGAWLNTKLERDKQLLGLSVSAVGLLVTLLRTVGVYNFRQIYFFGCALLCFLITIISVLIILDKNAQHIEEVLQGVKKQDENKLLSLLDNISAFAFVTGMVLVVIIGIDSAIIKYNSQGVTMSQDPQNKFSPPHTVQKHSWNGVSKLQPQASKAVPTNPTDSSASSSSEASGSSQPSNASSGNSGS
jgi:Ca2+/Na+ antiporter